MMTYGRGRSSVLVFAIGLALSLSACEAPNTGVGNSVENDWVTEPSPEIMSTPIPAVTVSVTPSSTPTVTPTVTPSPTGTATPTPTVTSTPASSLYTGPAEVAKYVQKFIDDAKMQGVDVLPDMKNPKLEIQIASLDSYGSTTIGLCQSGGSVRRVTFDPDFWNQVSDTQRELLAHHEFGHCVLYRAHNTAKLSSGAYSSIMYPIIMSSSTYNNNYAYYQQELFTQGASALPQGDVVHVCDLGELVGH